MIILSYKRCGYSFPQVCRHCMEIVYKSTWLCTIALDPLTFSQFHWLNDSLSKLIILRCSTHLWRPIVSVISLRALVHAFYLRHFNLKAVKMTSVCVSCSGKDLYLHGLGSTLVPIGPSTLASQVAGRCFHHGGLSGCVTFARAALAISPHC